MSQPKKPKSARERLAKYLERRKMNHEAFAKLAFCHQTTISAIMRGAAPSVTLALRIQKLTGITMSAWANATKRTANT